jgi:SAM-dependent methyltransferase
MSEKVFELAVEFTHESLEEAFQYLNRRRFSETGRLPLVASRQWCPDWEAEAFKRFRSGQPNVQEVALPRWYWRLEKNDRRRLFFALTLGRPDSELAHQPELAPFYPVAESKVYGEGVLQGSCPLWTVVPRFGRYVLRSHPDLAAADFVYFGDDTLFLMQRSREFLAQLQGEMERPLTCLDLCCGSGGVGLGLPPFDGEVHGVDLNAVAIQIAHLTAQAQALPNYSYRCCDAETGLEGRFDLVFGNPPTLSPTLTGKDVFHATGTLDAFRSLLSGVMDALKSHGYALLTLFSEVRAGEDAALEAVREVVGKWRGFRYRVRREFSLGGQRTLRHCALELLPESSPTRDFEPLLQRGVQLPWLNWRRG